MLSGASEAMTTLLPITTPTPVYEGMLALATTSEREIILAGGPRELLDDHRMFGYAADHDAAMAAFDAMKGILTRVTSGTELCVTGIDPRMMPPRRERLDPGSSCTAFSCGKGRSGCMSRLLLAFLYPVIHIGDLRIEPTGREPYRAPAKMSRSTRLKPGERIDDASRLILMQRFIDQGETPRPQHGRQTWQNRIPIRPRAPP